MEAILEKIIELAEKIWLRLDILLDLDNMKVLDFLKPLLANISSDPILLGLTVAVAAIVLYSIYKIKRAHADKEKRLDALLQELDEIEENDDVDIDTPLFSNQTLETSGYGESSTNTSTELEQEEPDSEIYGDEFESPPSGEKITAPDQASREVMEGVHWDSTIEEWDELYDNISEELQEIDEAASVSSKFEQKKTTQDEIDQTPQKIMDDDFNWDSTFEEWDELYDNVSERPRETDASTATSSQVEAISELEKDVEPVPEGEEFKPESLETDKIAPPQPIAEVLAPPAAVPERIELSLEEIEVVPELESDLAKGAITPKPPQPEPVVTKSSVSPFLKSIVNSSVSEKTDALVSRLKTFQAELETRFNSLEIEPEAITKALANESLRKKQSKYQPAKVSYRSKPKLRSNKQYLSQLESFIFMAKQTNQRTDT